MRIEYQRHHRWLRRELGRADAHVCECGAQARDWAFDEPTGFAYDTARYRPLCRRCHIETDKVNANKWKTHCLRGHEFTEENTYTYRGRRQCRTCHRITWRQRQCRATHAI